MTDYSGFTDIDLDIEIERLKNFEYASLSSEKNPYELAKKEKQRRITKQRVLESNQQKQANDMELRKADTLHEIKNSLNIPWYKTANGWFSFIAMIAALASLLYTLIQHGR